MTREEAIHKISGHKSTVCLGCMHPQEVGWCENHCKIKEALDMAIEALEEPETGKWIGGELGECSVCGYGGCASDIWNGYHRDTYCPSCGAHLEV